MTTVPEIGQCLALQAGRAGLVWQTQTSSDGRFSFSVTADGCIAKYATTPTVLGHHRIDINLLHDGHQSGEPTFEIHTQVVRPVLDGAHAAVTLDIPKPVVTSAPHKLVSLVSSWMSVVIAVETERARRCAAMTTGAGI